MLLFIWFFKVWIGMTFDTLQVVGRYRMSSWFSTSSGDFNVTLIRVHAEGFAGLVVDSEGLMQATNITFDVGFKDITMKFENLGFFGSLFQVTSVLFCFLKQDLYKIANINCRELSTRLALSSLIPSNHWFLVKLTIKFKPMSTARWRNLIIFCLIRWHPWIWQWLWEEQKSKKMEWIRSKSQNTLAFWELGLL